MRNTRAPLIPLIALIGLCLLTTVVSAESDGWVVKQGERASDNPLSQTKANAAFLKRYPIFVDDITPDQHLNKVKLTPAQIHQAKVWELTLDQEKRYVLLMQNRSGVQYAGQKLSPVEILGLNARDDKERNQLAHLAAEQEAQFIAKNLSFASSYHKQYVALMRAHHLTPLKDFPVKSYAPDNYRPFDFKADDHIYLWLHPSTPIKPVMAALMQTISTYPSIHWDIYLVGNPTMPITADTVDHWATTQSVPPRLVSSGQIRLHISTPAQATSHGANNLPTLYVMRDGKRISINTGRF